ncbi:MAG: four helix bundle protein [Pirellulales bacterium]|nr:four helix bundle protein [Pirellulales bacterium]
MRSHRDLGVWQLGMRLAERIYAITQAFPPDERFGLTSQQRRAAASVPANIAEGNARDYTQDYLRFLSITIGSLAEVETYLELAVRLQYGAPEHSQDVEELIAEERRMLRGLQRSLRSKLIPPSP